MQSLVEKALEIKVFNLSVNSRYLETLKIDWLFGGIESKRPELSFVICLNLGWREERHNSDII
jgi:hypothetical protein